METTIIITFLRRLFHMRRTKRSFESPRYLLKWLPISSLIGIVAGIGAIAFFAAIHYATGFFLGYIVGYTPPDPAGEGSVIVQSFWSSARPWLLPVVTTLGGLAAGIIVFSLAPEAEGHGTDAAIHAFHQGKPIRARIPLIKLNASKMIMRRDHSKPGVSKVATFSPVAHIRLPKVRRFSCLGDLLWWPAWSHDPLHVGRLYTSGTTSIL